MKHIIKGNVERIVSDDAVAKWEKEGFELIGATVPETDQTADQATAKKKAEAETKAATKEEAKTADQATAKKKAEAETKAATKEEAKTADQATAKKKAEAETKAATKEEAKTADQAAAGENTAENAEKVDYSSMKLNDLRKIAKEKGIQGYNNMNQATLAAVIQAH